MQHVLSKICKPGIFFNTYFLVVSYDHNIRVFNFLSLIFSKTFHFLVTVFSTPSFSVCFSLGTVSPPLIPTLKVNYSWFCSLSLHTQLRSLPTGRHSPSTYLPQIHQSFWPLEIPLAVLEAPTLATCDHFQRRSTGSRHRGARKSRGLPPYSSPTYGSGTSGGHLHLQCLPCKGGNLPPCSTWEIAGMMDIFSRNRVFKEQSISQGTHTESQK